MKLPVTLKIGQNPSLPLIKQVNGVWLPTVAEDPCTCCAPTDLCNCCSHYIFHVTESTVILAGLQDHACDPPFTIYGEASSVERYSVLNGTYTIAGRDGDIFWGALGDKNNKGRLLVDVTFFNGGTCRTYVYGCHIRLAGCGGNPVFLGWQIEFYGHTFLNGIYSPGTVSCNGHPGGFSQFVNPYWGDICKMQTPGATWTYPHGGCSPVPPGTYSITGSSKCDGCQCP